MALESISPDVGTAHAITSVVFHGNGLEQKLPTLGCRFGDRVVAPLERFNHSVRCLSPAAMPGFVVVGFSHVTGKTYAPGRDDLSKEQGYNVFEYVEPWRIHSVFPEEIRSSGGQKLFLAGRDARPNLRCHFLGSGASLDGGHLEFVSSALAVCESEPSARSIETLMLGHDSHAAPGGQQMTLRYRPTASVLYGGGGSATPGESIAFVSSSSDESGTAPSSRASRTGCQFGGVWTAASPRGSPSELGCVVPASSFGATQVTVSDLHSLTPLPLLEDARLAAVDDPASGRFLLRVREAPVVDALVPSSGTPGGARADPAGVDVFGQRLSFDDRSALARFCARRAFSPTAEEESARARCAPALTDAGALGSARAFGPGFNALGVTGGVGFRAGVDVQFALFDPPRIVAATTTAARDGDVLTVVGENFRDASPGTKCVVGETSGETSVASSAVARCVLFLDEPSASGGSTGASSSGLARVGVGAGDFAPRASSLLVVAWLSRSPRVGTIAPDAGYSDGGARVTITAASGGLGAARFHPSVACRFGAVHPVAASAAGADAVGCAAPALAPGSVPVGAPDPGLFENAIDFRVVNAAAVLITAAATSASVEAGLSRFSAAGFGREPSPISFACAPGGTAGGADAVFGPGGQWTCGVPTSRPGFTALDIAAVGVGAARERVASCEIRIVPRTPPSTTRSGESYAGDVLFLLAAGGGFERTDLWCVTRTEGAETRSSAHVVSSALAACEVPSFAADGSSLPAATVSACASEECGFVTSAPARTRDGGGRLIVSAEKTLTDVSPTHASTGGGETVVVRVRGPSADASRRYSACRLGTIGPVSASAATVGGATALECVAPAHAPGVVPVAVARGAGWEGEWPFAYVETAEASDVDGDDTLEAALAVDASASDTCAANAPAGDVVAVEPTFGSSEGGTEIVVVLGSVAARPADECAGNWAACRVGTAWPVLGYLTATGVSCVAPARAPGTTEVSAPRMLAGAGRPFAYLAAAGNPSAVSPDDGERVFGLSERASAPRPVGVKAHPRFVGASARVDAALGGALGGAAACVFSAPASGSVRAATRATALVSVGHAVSATVVLCETPSALDADGVAVLERSAVDALAADAGAASFAGLAAVSACASLPEVAPARGSPRGGVVVTVTSGCLARWATSDARLGCRFGSIGPVTAAAGFEGETFRAACVAPARAPGVAPVALVPDWRDAAFVPSATFAYVDDRGDGEGGSGSGIELARLALPESGGRRAPEPFAHGVVPWVTWGGGAAHVAGRDFPGGGRAACAVGGATVPAHHVSSALVLCDPFSAVGGMALGVGGSAAEVSLRVVARSEAEAATNAAATADAKDADAALSLFVVRRAAVIGVDFGSGWAAGGGHVDVELAAWAPTGMLDCHFGAVHVRGRGLGGAAWATAGEARERWADDAVAATSVECVAPASRVGRVPLGVSLARSNEASFGEDVEYQYF